MPCFRRVSNRSSPYYQRIEAQTVVDEKRYAADAKEKSTGLVARLRREESQRMRHSELESFIASEGREIYRRARVA